MPSDRIPEGARRETLLRLTVKYHRIGLSSEIIRLIRRETNTKQCDPPLDDENIDAIAKRAGRADGFSAN